MKTTKALLVAVSLLAGAQTASPKTSVPVAAMPIGSPGEWIGANDYPVPALRFHMTGVTAFRLAVDATGKPARCDIVTSSGFDVLDSTTCQRLMANARFTPSRDRSGKPTEGSYTNRVRWVLPEGAAPSVSERFASMMLSIDQTGHVTSCHFVVHVPAEMTSSDDIACKQALSQPLAMGVELRGNAKTSLANIEIQVADVFTPALRARILSATAGTELRALNVHHFTVSREGKLGECNYEEQRGSELLAADFCSEAGREHFDPPFSAFDQAGVANGWHIMRVLLKTDQ